MPLRESPLGELKVPLAWTAAVALAVALLAAVILLLSDRRETFQEEAYGVSRQVGDAVVAPVGEVLSTPLGWIRGGVDHVRGYFFAVSENRRLKAELAEARRWRDVALAQADVNERYKALLGLKTDPPVPMVAARTITDARGPFANSRLANAGKERGVRIGNPVMSETGLVGRVVGVTNGASRVLLLTDIAARTPVMIDRTNARAILTGDGGPNPKLEYLRGRDPVREGDRVVTSGDGGIFPRGLPVGVAVKGLDGRWRVALASDRAPIDYVQILLFQDFSQLVDREELNRTQPPSMAGYSPPVGIAPTPQAPSAAPRPQTPSPAPATPAPAPQAQEAQPQPAEPNP
ncbi:MAG: rod shape-determining protein MreC [Phenylobacterium sp.]|uniref:rod shape-determining protein MreC n=1 Tax=Phenylobacterium sp. TaxID=1871053 RepID=UPI0039191ADA